MSYHLFQLKYVWWWHESPWFFEGFFLLLFEIKDLLIVSLNFDLGIFITPAFRNALYLKNTIWQPTSIIFWKNIKLYNIRDTLIKIICVMASGGSVGWNIAHRPKRYRFNSRSGHIPRLCVWFPVRAHTRRQPINVSVSHRCCTLSPSLSPFLPPSLPLSLKAMKNVLG